MMAVAAVDRLIHHAYVVELSGESYRKRAHTNTRKQAATPES
jgi:DNA replication protein DnaC